MSDATIKIAMSALEKIARLSQDNHDAVQIARRALEDVADIQRPRPSQAEELSVLDRRRWGLMR